MRWNDFNSLFDAALAEDRAEADATTRALIPPGARASARLKACENGVICGLPLMRQLAARCDEKIVCDLLRADGDQVRPGSALARLNGPASSLLGLERTALNFLQRLSGIATLSAKFVDRVKGTRARIYDTRKTTPGLRELERYAVRCGGAQNHRLNLAGAVLIKDNHLVLLDGDVRRAVQSAREKCPDLPVEVEVEDIQQVGAALESGADIILLDNMCVSDVAQVVALADALPEERRPALEASGGISLDNVVDYARTGVERIAIGALTHSAPALDISIELAPVLPCGAE
ncbi:MAG: carboxylating nicotinate-nucleotide diphosphorylase [Planctomycetes bacterium]|nr:carboxylating nicotinate-nucleotide diphosphorylase [Planctomycetota bacterium]